MNRSLVLELKTALKFKDRLCVWAVSIITRASLNSLKNKQNLLLLVGTAVVQTGKDRGSPGILPSGSDLNPSRIRNWSSSHFRNLEWHCASVQWQEWPAGREAIRGGSHYSSGYLREQPSWCGCHKVSTLVLFYNRYTWTF